MGRYGGKQILSSGNHTIPSGDFGLGWGWTGGGGFGPGKRRTPQLGWLQRPCGGQGWAAEAWRMLTEMFW